MYRIPVVILGLYMSLYIPITGVNVHVLYYVVVYKDTVLGYVQSFVSLEMATVPE